MNYDSLTNPRKTACIYAIKCEHFFKVGITTNKDARLATLSRMNPFDLSCELYRTIPYRHAHFIEKHVHDALSEWHHRGEWFTASLPEIKSALVNAIRAARARENEFRREYARMHGMKILPKFSAVV